MQRPRVQTKRQWGISKPQTTGRHCTVSFPGVVGLSTSANIILGSVGAAIGASVEEAIDSWTDQENQEETVDTKMIVQITQ